ncbi:uncharacterized protein LOC142604658 [Balearica regulorum gibbericeps]|uniref:uncharacterized protein LOC142604658 n=1 Tax=Balearica regulorum gibbericeps TaxID=100784 RepID=UPI003F5E7E7B
MRSVSCPDFQRRGAEERAGAAAHGGSPRYTGAHMPRTRRRAARGVTCSPCPGPAGPPRPPKRGGARGAGRAGSAQPRGGRRGRAAKRGAGSAGAGRAPAGRGRGVERARPPRIAAERGPGRSAPGPTAAPGSCPARAGPCASPPRGTPAFPARRRPTHEASLPGNLPAAGGARGARGHQPDCTAHRVRARRVQPPGGRPAGAPRAASLPATGGSPPPPPPPCTGRSPERLCSRLRPPRSAFPPTAPGPGPPPLQCLAAGQSHRPALPEREPRRSGPQPGKSRRRVRSAMTDSARSPSLRRINVSELQSVVTNNNNNKLSGCCSVAQTNACREPRGASPRLAAGPPGTSLSAGPAAPRPQPRGGSLLARQPHGAGDRAAPGAGADRTAARPPWGSARRGRGPREPRDGPRHQGPVGAALPRSGAAPPPGPSCGDRGGSALSSLSPRASGSPGAGHDAQGPRPRRGLRWRRAPGAPSPLPGRPGQP